MTERKKIDFLILLLTLILVSFGIVMVFSASSIIAYMEKNDHWYYTIKQGVWAIIGITAMLIIARTPYNLLKKAALPIAILSFLSLIIVLIFGSVQNGAKSWLIIAGFSIQPAEYAKISLILYLAALIAKKGEKIENGKKGFLPLIIVTLLFFGLIAVQPDYGTALILLVTAIIMIYVGGARLIHIVKTFLPMLGLISFLIILKPYRLKRFTSFLDPWSDPTGSGYHLIQSLYALGNGGITGVGFGQSVQKYMYLPFPHSDFIFSIIAEELGFIGITILFIILLILFWRILFVTQQTNDVFGQLIGIGVVTLLGVQTFVNIGGVIGAIPITGVTLPFISYGGSSLTSSLIAIGIILNISRQVK